MDRWATFDCYGTLIDWERGIRDALGSLWPDADPDALLARYHEFEPMVQSGSAMPYREVMAEVQRLISTGEGRAVPDGQEYALAESLPSWPAFPEVPDELRLVQQRGWKVALLSNTDPDLLASSIRHLGIRPELTVTAAEAGSYKPALGHWNRFRELAGIEDEEGEPGMLHVHVAASLFHDIAPAEHLGIPAVWINRLHETSDLPRAAELPDLRGLVGVLDRLAP
jgi:2-haloacid dehalogenase